MIERFLQVTCDGCGETEMDGVAYRTYKSLREEMRQYGWTSVGPLDYCRRCVENGKAKRRYSIFGELHEVD